MPYDRVGRPVNTVVGYFVGSMVEDNVLAVGGWHVGCDGAILLDRWERVLWEVSRMIE